MCTMYVHQIVAYYIFIFFFFLSDHLKTQSDYVREKALLEQLVLTVMDRNKIVESIEEDRLR